MRDEMGGKREGGGIGIKGGKRVWWFGIKFYNEAEEEWRWDDRSELSVLFHSTFIYLIIFWLSFQIAESGEKRTKIK